jgi:hypothetical protein
VLREAAAVQEAVDQETAAVRAEGKVENLQEHIISISHNHVDMGMLYNISASPSQFP